MTVKESKTRQALRMLSENPDLSAYAVSKIVGIINRSSAGLSLRKSLTT
ncbi:MAG: hypothetical protein QOC89_3354 [Paraburkholderia sp.]|nr:hypothetical protein [Paraburkholderia sp.]MEA3085657.1 hypothetical protein [Paraburkholderia sp.]